jgi:hypothetical protein
VAGCHEFPDGMWRTRTHPPSNRFAQSIKLLGGAEDVVFNTARGTNEGSAVCECMVPSPSCPCRLYPQHSTELSSRTPQL